MSQQSVKISMRSKKQHIRLWFECLQICQSQSQYQENLMKSQNFYDEWGDIQCLKFDDWWKQKKYLFEELLVREVTKVSSNPNTITVSIPLNENVSKITQEIKRLVESHQTKRLRDQKIDPNTLKSKVCESGKYRFTKKEIKGKFHYINLEIYKIFLELDKPPINRQFLITVRQRFADRYRSKLSKNIVWIPQMTDFETTYSTNGDCEDIIRTVRRGLRGVEKTLLNVSKGCFP